MENIKPLKKYRRAQVHVETLSPKTAAPLYPSRRVVSGKSKSNFFGKNTKLQKTDFENASIN